MSHVSYQANSGEWSVPKLSSENHQCDFHSESRCENKAWDTSKYCLSHDIFTGQYSCRIFMCKHKTNMTSQMCYFHTPHYLQITDKFSGELNRCTECCNKIYRHPSAYEINTLCDECDLIIGKYNCCQDKCTNKTSFPVKICYLHINHKVVKFVPSKTQTDNIVLDQQTEKLKKFKFTISNEPLKPLTDDEKSACVRHVFIPINQKDNEIEILKKELAKAQEKIKVLEKETDELLTDANHHIARSGELAIENRSLKRKFNIDDSSNKKICTR
jgi:hypothetical protein